MIPKPNVILCQLYGYAAATRHRRHPIRKYWDKNNTLNLFIIKWFHVERFLTTSNWPVLFKLLLFKRKNSASKNRIQTLAMASVQLYEAGSGRELKSNYAFPMYPFERGVFCLTRNIRIFNHKCDNTWSFYWMYTNIINY